VGGGVGRALRVSRISYKVCFLNLMIDTQVHLYFLEYVYIL
jgi:hypothetical protein